MVAVSNQLDGDYLHGMHMNMAQKEMVLLLGLLFIRVNTGL